MNIINHVSSPLPLIPLYLLYLLCHFASLVDAKMRRGGAGNKLPIVWKGHGHYRSVPGTRSGVQGQSQGPGTLSVSRPGSSSPDTPTPQNALLCPFSNSERRNSFRSFHLLLAGEGGRAFNASSLQPTVAVCLNCCNQLIERFRDLTIYLVFAARRPDEYHKSRILSFTTDSFVSTVSTVSLRFARGC